jgi:diguanylate cyclase (GGDEF)-like protein
MYLKNFFSDKKAIFTVAIGIFIFLEILVLLAGHYVKKSEINNYLSVYSPNFRSHVEIANRHLTDISKIFYDTEINNPDIIDIISQASKTEDKEKLAVLRDRLHRKLSETYGNMLKYNVGQLHFHLPEAVSFLRFHKPKKFGDSLLGIRETLEYVNEYKTPISAFEEGRIFNGFRNVYPIYKGKEFVGTVEISFSFDAMQNVLSYMDATSYLFIIKSSIVGKKVFTNEKVNYTKSEFKDFDYDKKSLKNSMQIGLDEMLRINGAIAKEVDSRLEKGELFSLYFKSEDIYQNYSIIISFSPVSNLDNKIVAYIIHYDFGNFIDIILSNIKVIILALTLLAALIIGGLAFILINEHKKQNEMHHFAVHDALTGIYNRHGVNEILNQKIAEYTRNSAPLSVIFFDIDFFKRVNDTYGHDMGDYVLENIAKIVSKSIRLSDVFARWGGEEFILFLPNTEISAAIAVAEKLRKSIQSHGFSDIDTITCSFGVTQLQAGESKSAFIKRVDTLLYKAKESGRNCVISDFET